MLTMVFEAEAWPLAVADGWPFGFAVRVSDRHHTERSQGRHYMVPIPHTETGGQAPDVFCFLRVLVLEVLCDSDDFRRGRIKLKSNQARRTVTGRRWECAS